MMSLTLLTICVLLVLLSVCLQLYIFFNGARQRINTPGNSNTTYNHAEKSLLLEATLLREYLQELKNLRPPTDLIIPSDIFLSKLQHNQQEIFLEPVVSLPQKKLHFFQLHVFLRDERNKILPIDDNLEHPWWIALHKLLALRMLQFSHRQQKLYPHISMIINSNYKIWSNERFQELTMPWQNIVIASDISNLEQMDFKVPIRKLLELKNLDTPISTNASFIRLPFAQLDHLNKQKMLPLTGYPLIVKDVTSNQKLMEKCPHDCFDYGQGIAYGVAKSII